MAVWGSRPWVMGLCWETNFCSDLVVFVLMGRKRDLKNVHAKRPPSFNPEDPDDLNEWGEELARMTDRRRQHNERHKPGKSA